MVFRRGFSAGAFVSAGAPSGTVQSAFGGAAFSLRDRAGRIDETDVAEGLREVAEHLTRRRIGFLSQQADAADERDGTFEHLSGSQPPSAGRCTCDQQRSRSGEGSIELLDRA